MLPLGYGSRTEVLDRATELLAWLPAHCFRMVALQVSVPGAPLPNSATNDDVLQQG